MDEQAVVLAIRVADAFDAWLSDPRDLVAYERLVTAGLRYRAYRHPQLKPADKSPSRSPDELTDELLDELADQSPPAPVGALLEGPDTQEILGRLRRQM